jgi:hypothetical protein
MIYAAAVASTGGAWGGYPRPLPSRTLRIRGGATVAPDPAPSEIDMATVNGAPLTAWLKSCPPRSVAVSAALDAATADALDDYCARHRCTRSEAVRRILRDALRQVPACR